jgi:putative DNA methylase
MILRKKLIEVALPLDAINKASAREKSIRQGHPSTLHLWWARRPLAAARAVIFSQMIDDPSEHIETLLSDPAKKREATRELIKRREAWKDRKAKHDEAGIQGDQSVPGAEPTLGECVADLERQRLFGIIRQFVLWENSTNEKVLQQARDEIWQSWRYTCAENADHPLAKELFDRHKLPAFHDPFAGGGSLPLEAQRLGLEAYASDLNPVAVLINKAMIEIPPKFANQPPVNPEAQKQRTQMDKKWRGAQGLADDVRYYGQWMRDEAERRIGHLYPKVEVTPEMARERPDLEQYVGQKLTVIAWLWARTVKSPNPAFAHVDVPLASTFMLSTKAGKEAYVQPVIEGGDYHFTVKIDRPKDAAAAKSGTKLSRGANFQCLMSGTPMSPDYIKSEGRAKRMSARLMAVVVEGQRGRVYLAPTPKMEALALTAQPTWSPETPLPADPRNFWTVDYGLAQYGDLFTPRQLVALTTFSDLVQHTRERVKQDAVAAGLREGDKTLTTGGVGAIAYGEAVAVYMACAAGKLSDYNSTICSWISGGQTMRNTFGRQAIPMAWDFAEANALSESTGSFLSCIDQVRRVVLELPANASGGATQSDAQTQVLSRQRLISTDPPYYDNIGYADLSDFFYVWMRRSLKPIYPELFSTLGVPKYEELVATPYRHGSREEAQAFFINGMTQAMHRLANQSHPAFPVTIYYAFKQAESDGAEGTTNTGWDTFLAAVINAGFAISGTWPMRTEMGNRMVGSGTNVLASSIVLVCRPRASDAPTATRREFMAGLKTELPAALAHLQRGNIAPVDLAQAAIGPGMAIYTRYSRVLDAAGKTLPVSQALALINQTLDEALAEQESDFDSDTRWALTWFEQSAFTEGEYGVAEQLSKSKNTSVDGLAEAGIVQSKRGKVRLLKPEELSADWDPLTDKRLTHWETVHQLIRVLEAGGEGAAAEIIAKLGSKAEVARELCYRLYTLCERNKRAAEALSYNGLVQSWPEITRLARDGGKAQAEQRSMFGTSEELVNGN